MVRTFLLYNNTTKLLLICRKNFYDVIMKPFFRYEMNSLILLNTCEFFQNLLKIKIKIFGM